MRREDGVVRFFCALLFATFAMLGVALSVSYFEMLLFFGMVTLSSYLLIAHWWQREEAAAAAVRAFIISAIGDLALLAAVAYIYLRFNELNFQTLAGQYVSGRIGANGLFAIAILIFIAAAAKSALFPRHPWLPGSAQAPAPAAALLHSAGGALCGVYLIARTYGLFHASPRALALLAIAGGISALLGVLWALFQDNLKRAIAYTTMGELGLMVLALGIGAYGAGVFELFTHAWPMALLFLAAGVIIRELRTERLSEMGGLWPRMRFTGSVMAIAVVAAAGVPPFSTFWSKDTIMSKALALNSPLAIAVIVAVTFLGAMALVRIFALVFTRETARRRRLGHLCAPGPRARRAAAPSPRNGRRALHRPCLPAGRRHAAAACQPRPGVGRDACRRWRHGPGRGERRLRGRAAQLAGASTKPPAADRSLRRCRRAGCG